MINLIKNRYQIQKKLGVGGMGTVYQAMDRLKGHSVALKLLEHVSGNSEKDLELALALAQEFKTLAALRHPFIVSVLDYGFDDRSRPYFTMDLLVDAHPFENIGQSVRIEMLLQLLQALNYLHRQGVIHRDLKPANVLIMNGQVKVLDFGLAIQGEELEKGGE